MYQWFEHFRSVLEEHNFGPQDIWNLDESPFESNKPNKSTFAVKGIDRGL